MIKVIKILLKIAVVIVLLFVLLYAGVSMYVSKKGKVMVITQLEKALQTKVTLDSVKLVPLFNLEIKGLDIEHIGKAETIYITPSILSIFTKSVFLSEIKIIGVVVAITRNAAPPPAETAAVAPPGAVEEKKVEAKKIKVTANTTAMPVVVKHLVVKSGSLMFTDNAISSEGVKIPLENVKVDLENVSLVPVSAITNFTIKASLPWQKEKKTGTLKIDGWLNLVKKDMQATVQLEDIDALSLYPYYSSWLDLEKTKIISAKLGFTSNIQGHSNDVVAANRLTLKDIVFKPRAADEPQERAEKIATIVIDMFKAMDGGDIALNFTIKTKMDNPKFNVSDIKMAFEEKIKKVRSANAINPEAVMTLPGKIIGGTFKGATDITKGVLSGTFQVGKELKDALEWSFKKESAPVPEESQPQAESVGTASQESVKPTIEVPESK